MKITKLTDPYELDYFVDNNGKKYPALTKKNADFIRGIVYIDSYGRDLDPSIEKSTAYWFKEMCNKVNTPPMFGNYIKGAVTSIDKVNSTHLEAAVKGRETEAERIIDKCKNAKELKNKLKEKFETKNIEKELESVFIKKDNTEHIITTLTEKIIGKKTPSRYNISFASKFCAYAAKFLECERQYSKYDNIVSEYLPVYVKEYLEKTVSADEYKIKHNTYKGKPDKEQLEHRLDIYASYSEAIEDILDVVNNSGENIDKEEFDHIIWYAMKGKAYPKK